MNVAGVLLLRFIGSLPHERRSPGRLRGRLHGALLADHVDVGRTDGRGGDDRRAEPRRRQAGAGDRGRAGRLAHRPGRGGRRSGRSSSLVPNLLLAIFGMNDPVVLALGAAAAAVPGVSGLFVTVALSYTGAPAGHGRHAQPALHLDRVADRRPARALHDPPGDPRPDARRHLDGDRARAHDPRRAERREVPAPEVAVDPGRDPVLIARPKNLSEAL